MGWTALQDAQLKEAVQTRGGKWALVAAQFPGHSALDCQRRAEILDLQIAPSPPRLKGQKRKHACPSPPKIAPTSRRKGLDVKVESCLSSLPPIPPSVKKRAIEPPPDIQNKTRIAKKVSKVHSQALSYQNKRFEIENLWKEHAPNFSDQESALLAPKSIPTMDAMFAELQQQINQNFQLSTQLYVLQREIHGEVHSETLWWQQQLISSALFFDQLQSEHSFSVPSILEVSQIFQLDFFGEHSSRRREFLTAYNQQISSMEKNRFLAKRNERIMSHGSLAPSRRSKKGLIQIAPIPESLLYITKMFRDFFDVKLVPNMLRVRKCRTATFHEMEDELLFEAVKVFGLEDYRSIRAHFLPTKSVREIQSRISNMTVRNSKWNNVKMLYLMPFKPMNLFEKIILCEGARSQGANFRRIALQLFVHHPRQLIRETWESLYCAGLIGIPYSVTQSSATSGLFDKENTEAPAVEENLKSSSFIPDKKVIVSMPSQRQPFMTIPVNRQLVSRYGFPNAKNVTHLGRGKVHVPRKGTHHSSSASIFGSPVHTRHYNIMADSVPSQREYSSERSDAIMQQDLETLISEMTDQVPTWMSGGNEMTDLTSIPMQQEDDLTHQLLQDLLSSPKKVEVWDPFADLEKVDDPLDGLEWLLSVDE